MRALAFLAGVAVVLATLSSLVRTLVVPRGLSSRLTKAVERATFTVFDRVAARLRGYEAKDRLLAKQGPAVLLALLATWVVVLLFGFGLLLYGVTSLDVGASLREAGSSLFTLGFASTPGRAVTVVDFLAAATGLVVVALQIAYLPTLYSAFNRREVLVSTLEARAGAPAWGPEILARHQLVGLTDTLSSFYDEWEKWAADVAESHTNYPVLATFRSPKPLRSWVVGLLSVMDSAALYLALCPETAPTQARLCLRMGFSCLRDIASVLGIPFDPDPMPDAPIQLTYDEFLAGIARLDDPRVGFARERSAEEAWPHFRGWRVNYESVAYALANLVVAPPGPWSGPRHHLPGLAIAPVRPADRRPDEPMPDERERGAGHGW